jgi:tetratricopeptide (TPR) repeat protein
LLAKAQSVLETEDYEAALRLVDEALHQDPRNTEALVKKGGCLEGLRKLNEAVACYDQAIAIDNTLTVAYLHKGGLFNRMERFSEALQCYELALRTQEHKAAHAESVTN